jgi:hypothetical protein
VKGLGDCAVRVVDRGRIAVVVAPIPDRATVAPNRFGLSGFRPPQARVCFLGGGEASNATSSWAILSEPQPCRGTRRERMP